LTRGRWALDELDDLDGVLLAEVKMAWDDLWLVNVHHDGGD
jgi:hypothetical protein